ncbi:aminoacyl-tRNA hydrolase [Candidatus Uhrbacteria bacterium]|nr:aminoacyl-tRNA hydrolase [Candidatus Uhrbacteria bacterium]
MQIPFSELQFQFTRSGGKGGQNVNKVSSKVQLRWNVFASSVFSDAQKFLIQQRLASRINQIGEVCLESDQERSQAQNKEWVIHELHRLITQALKPIKKRRATKATRSSQKKRLASKIKHGEKKASRKLSEWHGI